MYLIAEPILDRHVHVEETHKTLGILLVGHDPASELYVGIKQARALEYGLKTQLVHLEGTATQTDVLSAVHKLNSDSAINALIVQLPLPGHIDTDTILDAINSKKDVDNLTGSNNFISPMVQAVASLVKHYNIELSGKNICVVGYGRLIGWPVSHWLEANECKPTIINGPDEFDADVLLAADVIFAGTGQKHIINQSNTRSGQTVFDCSGVDVDYESIKDTVQNITPPKGGIGPLTVHFLLTNTLKA